MCHFVSIQYGSVSGSVQTQCSALIDDTTHCSLSPGYGTTASTTATHRTVLYDGVMSHLVP